MKGKKIKKAILKAKNATAVAMLVLVLSLISIVFIAIADGVTLTESFVTVRDTVIGAILVIGLLVILAKCLKR